LVAFRFNLRHQLDLRVYLQSLNIVLKPSTRQFPGDYLGEAISVAHCAVLARGFHHHADQWFGTGGAD
jgi:hypothetical protein